MGLFKEKGYSFLRLSRYPNSDTPFHCSLLTESGDICPTPGPVNRKQQCQNCTRVIANNHQALKCGTCLQTYHIRCGKIKPRDYSYILQHNIAWKCTHCLRQQQTIPRTNLTYNQTIPPILSTPDNNNISVHSDDYLRLLAENLQN